MLRLEGMAEVFAEAARIAPRQIPILIQGETGAGKESVAHHIHQMSQRKGQFVAVNCGAIPISLFESELFGHERGAFTGAAGRRSGLIEAADRGTLFLDEIGELPLAVQASLLRVLDTGCVTPLGTSHQIRVNIGLVSATHRNLLKMCRHEKFREDLLHRINGFNLVVPPLRERSGDIQALVDYFLHSLFGSYGSYTVSSKAMELLLSHDWPGNVRELAHVVQVAAALAERGRIEAKHIRFWSRTSAEPPHQSRTVEKPKAEPPWLKVGLNKHLEAVEAEAIMDALARTGDRQPEAADLLKIPLRTFTYRLQRLRSAGLIPQGESPAEGARREGPSVPTRPTRAARGNRPLM